MINFRLAVRLLVKNPFVTAVAIGSLALGIGANTAIFSVFDQLLLRPLPVPAPGRLVNLAAPGPNPGSQSCGMEGDCNSVFSYPMLRDLEREQKSFTGIAAHVVFGANLSARNRTLSGQGLMVSGSYFPVLELQPALGRLLGPDDDRQPGGARVAVLSYDYWVSTFGSDPDVLNKSIVVNGETLTIVGVGPRGFTSTTVGLRPQVYVPITLRGLMIPGWNRFEDRTAYWAYLFARLKPGVTMARAAASINVPYSALLANVEKPLQQGMSAKTMEKFLAKKVVLSPGARGQSNITQVARTPLTLLLAVTVFVLLIACANIANLLLARGAARASEMAVRLSIGGSRAQLVGQLLAESAMLGLVGGVVSLAVARLTLGGMAALLPTFASETFDVHLDGRMVLFTAALSLGTALLFGLFPALQSTRSDLIASLRDSTGQPSGGRAAARWRTGLATVQVTLSMALLGSAALLARSLDNVSRVNLGAKIDHVLTFGVSPELNGYSGERSQGLFRRLTDRLRAIPGITGVSYSLVPLLADNNWGNDVDVEGYPTGPDVDNNSRFNSVGPDYFSTLGMPLITGREFTTADAVGSPQVAVVNQAFARKFRLGTNPVGHRMDMGNRKYDMEIVGLVKDAKYSSVKDSVPPLFFTPLLQDSSRGSASFYVRTSQDPNLLLQQIPRVVAALDPNLPVEDLRTMPEQVRQNIYLDRFVSFFSAGFAGLATLLAAIGLYGVLAYTVSQRTREIGVRMALGADAWSVRLLVLRQVGLMLLVGCAIGLGVSVAVGRLTQSLLYDVQGYDPLVLGTSALALVLVGLGAGLAPATKASRVDPIRALRWE